VPGTLETDPESAHESSLGVPGTCTAVAGEENGRAERSNVEILNVKTS
jgi:hypothetical protein